MNKFVEAGLVLGLMFSIASCRASDKGEHPKVAKAVVEPTEGNIVSGVVWFTETRNGTAIFADFYGLTPGKHGFHIHEYGDCSASDASSAGGHFNPTNKKHGAPEDQERHVGDLGNVDAKANGHGHYERLDKVISFDGETSIIGKSIIIHQDEDDYVTQPSGNAGKKIGCGVIELVNQ